MQRKHNTCSDKRAILEYNNLQKLTNSIDSLCSYDFAMFFFFFFILVFVHWNVEHIVGVWLSHVVCSNVHEPIWKCTHQHIQIHVHMTDADIIGQKPVQGMKSCASIQAYSFILSKLWHTECVKR